MHHRLAGITLADIPKTFIEFGVQNYRESNTRLLLQLRNWRGLIIDGSATILATSVIRTSTGAMD